MGIKDFFRKYRKYRKHYSVPTEKEKEKEKKKKLSVQDNSGKDNNVPAQPIRELRDERSVSFSDAPRSSENPSRLTNDRFHMHVEHGIKNGTLSNLHLIDTTNGKATFFLARCHTSEEQAKEAALQVMQKFQTECPNVLFFKNTAVMNAHFENESFEGKKDIYFLACNSANGAANDIQLHSTKNIIPDDMPFNLSPDKRFLHFGPLKQSEAFNTIPFKVLNTYGYDAYEKLDLPKLEKPLLTRPLNMDNITTCNKFQSNKDIYFFAGNSDLKSNGIQLHSTKNIIPDDMPFNLSPDKRFLHFGPLDQSEAFKSVDFKSTVFKENISNDYNAYRKLDVPKLERPLFTRPLNMDKVGHLEPVDPGETKENDLSQFRQTQITRKHTPEPSKFIIPKPGKMKPTTSDLPKKSKPYKRGV